MLTIFRKIVSLLDPHDRMRFGFLLIMLILVAVAEAAGVASIMPFMAVVTNPDIVHSNHFLSTIYEHLEFGSERAFLVFLGLSVFGLLVIGNAIKSVSTFLTLRYHNRLNYTLSRCLLACYVARPYQFFLKRNTAELGANVLTEVTKVITGVLNPATSMVSSLLVCVAIIALLVLVDPLAALAIAGTLGGAYAVILFAARRKLKTAGKQQLAENHERFKVAQEAMSGIKELKVLGREITLIQRFAWHAERHARTNVTVGLISQLPRHALETVGFGAILLIVVYLISRREDTSNIAAVLALYAFAGYRLMPALQQLFASIATLRFTAPSLDILFRDLGGDQRRIDDAYGRLNSVQDVLALPFMRELRFSRVSFQYEDTIAPALRDLDFVITPLSTVGLVGPTGCGKTTTVDLLLGLLSPTGGQFSVDGVAITHKNLASWQKNLGYVPQHIYLSDDTIAKNIAFGVPSDDIDIDAVRRAARVANIAVFIESELAEGYNTYVGERGVRLSGGQRQRIGIARALYRDPALLVMDEATSALDGITEESVMEALHNLSRQKTIVVIAHRLTTVRDCDVIYLLDKGSIVASGSYVDLMRDSTWFRAAAGE